MPDELGDRILKQVSEQDYRPVKVRALSRVMGVAEHEYGDFRHAVRALLESGRVVLGSKNSVMLPEASGHVVGVFRGNPRGFGFVVPDTPDAHGDLYIPEGETADAITGDRVQAQVLKAGRRGDRMMHKGRIVRVVQRGQSRFVGQLHQEDSRWFVVPDGKVLHVPIFVTDVGAKNAREGDQVVVEILTYPSPGTPARGVIVETLGRRGDPGVDTLGIIRQYQIPDAFPEAVLENARSVVQGYGADAAEGREDLSKTTIVTIDPDNARDFDDAISLRKLKDGTYELGVHIADVAAFVIEGSALDDEARERGNSVYLPRHVVPMLPEVLSNGVCSLQEAELRLTKSAFIRYDAKGRVKASRLANTCIRSAKRLTYGQATGILEGNTSGYERKIVSLVRRMEELARIIQARRLAKGMIVLDLPEVELVYDDDGRLVGVEPADTSYSHKIIEMFMVEANEAVARRLNAENVPFLRRMHPDPESDATANLSQFVRVLGHKVPAKLGRTDMQALLKNVKGRPESFAVNLAVLRSMRRAEYGPQEIGHFALASKHYGHFTSPIRRYPDLTVHRLFDRYVTGRLDDAAKHAEIPSIEDLNALGAHCSFTEHRADSAERELRSMKILQLLEKRLGDVMDGVVTGVANAGVFVQVTKYLIDGLVRFGDLPDDWWEVNAKAGCMIGQRSGRQIAIGDAVRVRLVAIDLANRELDLALEELPAAKPRSPSPRRDPKPRGGTPRAGARPKGRTDRQQAKKAKPASARKKAPARARAKRRGKKH